MSHVFHRHSKVTPPTIASGKGVYLIDTNGKQYFDGSGGAAVSCLGHGDPHVTQAIKNQLDEVAFAHTGFFTSSSAEKLATKLCEHAPAMDRVYIVSGGSEAMEAALKLARQYYVELGETKRSHVIARKQSYHGNTLGALATGGNMWRREPFSPLLVDTTHIDACYEYRDRRSDESEEEYGLRVADQLETEIERLGPENVMAFVAEPVVGATAGAVPPVTGYFKHIRQICDKYSILLILDEVMCGMGRTGTLFACEQDGIVPDITAVAKGLGAGYQPIGAMLCSAKIYETIKNGSGFFQHGHTYCGHPTASAAALAVLERITNDGLIDRVNLMGGKLKTALQDAFGKKEYVGDIRGRGLFLGIEFVKDKSSKEPFLAEQQIAKHIKKQAFEAGLVCYPMSGTIDGKSGDHLLLAPAFIIEDAHIDEIVGKLEITFAKTF